MLYMETCIRNIKEEDWQYFKAEAVKKNLKLGDFFSELLKEHKNSAKNPWDKILNAKKILNTKNAEDMHKAIKEFRKEMEFR